MPAGGGCGHTIVPVAGNGRERGCGFQLVGAGLYTMYRKNCAVGIFTSDIGQDSRRRLLIGDRAGKA